MKILPGQIWKTKTITDSDYSYIILSLESDYAQTLYREGKRIWRRTRKISKLQEALSLFFDLCSGEAATQEFEWFRHKLKEEIEEARLILDSRQSMLDSLMKTPGKFFEDVA